MTIMSETEQKRIFSRNLIRLIETSGKTQKEIAETIGVSPQTFNTWVQGIALPRMGKVQALADYFHINKSDLIDEEYRPADYTPLVHAAARNLMELPDEDVLTVSSIIEALRLKNKNEKR